jgi:hypothetical protein
MTNKPRRIVADAAGAVDQTGRNEFTAPFASLQSQSKLVWALEYARHGLHVFPLHSIHNGRCTCGRDCGKNAGKHPRVAGGFKAATTNASQIEAWWRKWPDANIGIATGSTSGIVVIDIDGAGGLAALQSLVAQFGTLPRTLIVKTSRGWHLYFRAPASGIPIPCSADGGLDVRGDGGYAVAPPSVHVSGHVYEWRTDIF